ncbi:MAG: single-stranded-DNA-specific exonuclease RecJ [Erysipelotrichaceae bacterium]|nr:single-stranded-DNA-specific exonuclease RecJ [Erysipelotrichaceae bacterium]
MKYQIKELKNYKNIQNKYKVNSLLAKILDEHDYDEKTLQDFLNPRLIYHDFSLFLEADMTLDRIHEAIDNDEKICIYGDYDCDGILATTILVEAFKELDVQVGYHIPNRYEDGYGLNVKRVKQIAQKGYSLIITVDNGVKAFEAVEVANELGVDVIITDHHQMDIDLPDACAVIHTKISPDYPFKEISGGFVAYKLASALLGHQDKYLYTLAAITTISDMMPLLDENRSLLQRGMKFMNEEKYPQLELLLGENQKYSSTTIGYIIAPKINSFGRLPEICNPNHLVKYFLKDASKELLMKISTLASQINNKRKTMTSQQYNLAKDAINDRYLYFSSPEVHEGLIGLIASRYTRRYERPSFVMHYDKENHLYKGSARSIDGFSLHEFFMQHQDLLETFGGHDKAGGFSVSEEHYEELHHTIDKSLENVTLTSIKEVIQLDEEDITVSNVESMSRLEPFGQENEAPLFLLKDVPIERLYLLSEGKHLKMDIGYKNIKIYALYFHHGKDLETIEAKDKVNLIGTLEINEFRNTKNINFMIKDII